MFFFLILILYYYLFVSFEKPVPKPLNIANKYVDLEGHLYENDVIVGTTQDPFDYDTQSTLPPFHYSIQSTHNTLKFQTNHGEWTATFTPEYYWNQTKISEKDECFGKGNTKVLATGQNLYKYILKQDLQSTVSKSTFSDIYQSANIFYYACKDDSIQSINVCPPGSIFDRSDCLVLNACTDQQDGFKYADPTHPQKYYECRNRRPVSKQCRRDELFQFDQCRPPKDVCFFQEDGYRVKTGHNTFLECQQKKAIRKTCPPNLYFLKTTCESEYCFNKTNETVTASKMIDWPFSFHQHYIQCENGKIKSMASCPSAWDYDDTEVDIVHLPQVFDGQKCVAPKLCENVKLEDAQAVVPAYDISRQMATWKRSQLFDSLHGFKCSPHLEEVKVPSGSLIKNYKIQTGCSPLVDKVPTIWWNQYYDCLQQTNVTCPKNQFFDGTHCRDKVKDSFRIKEWDVFKFNNLHVNNWFKPRVEDVNQTQITCPAGQEYIPSLNICTHPDCKKFTFLKSLKRSIKLDDEYECYWDAPAIKKRKYDKPSDLTLKFWYQKWVPKDNPFVAECKTGHRVKTGNVVLDRTLYMTCRENQPFVFCPSSDTLQIRKIPPYDDYFTCVPNDKVYEYIVPKDTNVHFFTNEILKIYIPANATFTYNGHTQVTRQSLEFIPNHLMKTFDFKSNKNTKIYFKTLVSNPPDTFIKDKQLRKVNRPGYVYDIGDDIETIKNLTFPSFDLEYSLEELNF